MKKKEEKRASVFNELDDICDRMVDNETLLAIHTNKTGCGFVISGDKNGDSDHAAVLGMILAQYLKGKSDEGIKRLGRIIVTAIELVAAVDMECSIKLSERLLRANANAHELKKHIEAFLNNNDNHESDCADCELNRTCNNDDAVAYRKANGIPSPKKCNGQKKGKN